MSRRLGIITSWKTSHGPQKSITTAPSEMTKATGIGSDGFNEFAAFDLSSSVAAAEIWVKRNRASAAMKPVFATTGSDSLGLILIVDVFTDPIFSDCEIGSNDNNHHISANRARWLLWQDLAEFRHPAGRRFALFFPQDKKWHQ